MSTFRYAVSVMPREASSIPRVAPWRRACRTWACPEVHGVRVGRRVELEVDAPDDTAARAIVERLATELFANPLIESFDVEPLVATAAPARSQRVRVGVVVFPGSNCDRDALYAATLVGAESFPIWHESADLRGADLVILPGGFAYGDYLRAGALARFSPVMGAVREHAARGGLLLGICNGFQVLAEAGLVPGALLRNASLRFEHRWVRLSVERHDTPFTRAHPGRHHAPDAHRPRRGQLLPARRRPGRPRGARAAWCSATPRRRATPTARRGTSRASWTRAARPAA